MLKSLMSKNEQWFGMLIIAIVNAGLYCAYRRMYFHRIWDEIVMKKYR